MGSHPSSHHNQANNFHRQGQTKHPANSRNQARHRTVPVIPAFIQGQIHDLLDSNPQGLPLTHFCRVFKIRYKAPIDSNQMGFQNDHEMLASVPNIVSLKQLAQGEVRVMLAGSKPSNNQQPIPSVLQQKSSKINREQDSDMNNCQSMPDTKKTRSCGKELFFSFLVVAYPQISFCFLRPVSQNLLS